MHIEQITCTDFRNISSACVSFSRETSALIGENAQGKTNLLEAVYLLACGKSFRAPSLNHLILHEKNTATISARISGDGIPFQLTMTLDRAGTRQIFKNGVRLSKLSEFLGLFRVVLFCPEHLGLVKDGPAKRRSFIDGAICQIRPYYASLLNEFKKVEAQRSALLKLSQKNPVPREQFAVWDERLAKVSQRIAFLRADYIRRLKETAPEHFLRISGGTETLSLFYESDVYQEGLSPEETEKKYLELLESGFSSDQKYGVTQRGVHRDDLLLKINLFPARVYSSQGQQRSAVLALKLAEGDISFAMTGQSPVVLLDDVLSELDEKRRDYITAGLKEKQVILTGCDPAQFGFVKEKIFVEKGRFSRENDLL